MFVRRFPISLEVPALPVSLAGDKVHAGLSSISAIPNLPGEIRHGMSLGISLIPAAG